MKNYFRNVLQGFVDERAEIVLENTMRVNPDFLVIDVDQDDMPEILFAFKCGREKYVGVLKRENRVWRLCNISDKKIGLENGIFTLVHMNEKLNIKPADIGKVMKVQDLMGENENHFIGMIDGQLYYGKVREEEQGEMQVIDFLQGDVTGTGCINDVKLMGENVFDSQGLVKNMKIQVDGKNCEGEEREVTLPEGDGYSPTMFLGDFIGNGVQNVLITFFSMPNGGYTYTYIYDFTESKPRLIFDSRRYNEDYNGLVEFKDNYKVVIQTERLGKRYVIDISEKGEAYLNQLYDENGKLKSPVKGKILGIVAVNPADFDSNRIYNLSTVQRIIGVDNNDDLGLLETFFRWDLGFNRFEPFVQYVLLIGEPL